jgi:prephenate dehydrogenase
MAAVTNKSGMADHTSIGFIGYGRFGKALGERFTAAGSAIRAYDLEPAQDDRVRADSPADVAASARFIVLAVPVARTGEALRGVKPHLSSRHVVLDVGSVKAGPAAVMAEILGRQVPWVGSHPLFGPTSLAFGERPLRAILCPSPLHPGAVLDARRLYESIGCEVLEEDAEHHDQRMAETHAVAYFLAKGILDAGLKLDSRFIPPSAQAVARAVEAVREDAGHLFASLNRQNRYAGQARRRLLDALARADEDLRRLPDAGEVPHHEALELAIPDLGARSPLLREARDLIDDLDSEILTLLTRRAELALKAAKAKAELGHGPHDPRREADLLADRRRRGQALGLSPDDVTELFEAILRFSRRVQVNARDTT